MRGQQALAANIRADGSSFHGMLAAVELSKSVSTSRSVRAIGFFMLVHALMHHYSKKRQCQYAHANYECVASSRTHTEQCGAEHDAEMLASWRTADGDRLVDVSGHDWHGAIVGGAEWSPAVS